jgi:peptide methionine sulfoxide reductase MsrB
MDRTLTAERSWSNSKFVCALADSDRHLGHVIKDEKWHAYDATHLNAILFT